MEKSGEAESTPNPLRKVKLFKGYSHLNEANDDFFRLASSLMSQKQSEAQQRKLQQPIATPEIQSSIKEVTSAIVHYVNDQTNRGSRSRSVSPSTRFALLLNDEAFPRQRLT